MISRVLQPTIEGKFLSYFWRTQQQQEIDLVEEIDGIFYAFELKWNEKRKAVFHEAFLKSYNPKEICVVTPKNYIEFLSE